MSIVVHFTSTILSHATSCLAALHLRLFFVRFQAQATTSDANQHDNDIQQANGANYQLFA